MVLALILLAAMQAVQPAAAAPQPTAGLVRTPGPGRAFLSPMGEPFFGRTANEDGLVVWFEQADANRDGVLTSDEMVADADRFFQLLDLKHDGEIDPDDVMHYEKVVAPELRIRPIFSSTTLPGGETDQHVDDESSAGQFGLLRNPEPVTSADSNWNRGVSPDEFRRAATKRFRLLDTNHTGRLTLAQLQDIRRSAATIAKRQSDTEAGPLADPGSAEYGSQSPY